ncbi:FHA domain-containing protein [Halobacteriovorax marinus]|uniref:FHA domain-containing protein n=1 Tax=Halobacteriovorax marinus TaxID=97084 RepID=UPI000BDF7200|nr:FHA domain-containing protein [Halobacteriovorax marinus]
MSKDINYELDIRFPDQSPHRVSVVDKLSIGSSEKSDLCVEDYNLSPLHLSFRTHNGVLSIHNLGGKNKTLLGAQELIHGKMYILNIGDELKLGDIEIFIREGDLQEETPEELKNLFEDKTDPVIETEPQDLNEFIPEETESEDMELSELDDEEEILEEENEEELSPLQFQSIDELSHDEEDEYDDEDYEDDGKEKTLVEKLTGIFKFKQKDLRKEIVAKNKSNSKAPTAPGFFTRFFSFIILLSLSFTIVDQVFPIFEVEQLLSKYVSDLQKIIKPIPYSNYLTSEIIYILATYIAVEILTTLLFGVNIAYLLMGVRSDSGLIASRAKGVLRSILSLMTSPFLIFDLPCIVKKRTLKELLTASRLHTPSRLKQSFGFIILFPLLALLPIYAPLIPQFERFQEREILIQNETRFSKKEEFTKKKWSSLGMGLNFEAKVSNNSLFFPVIKLKKNQAHVSLKLSSKKDVSSWGQLTPMEELSMLSEIKKFTKLNPILGIHYPDLKKDLSKKELSSLSVSGFEQLYQLIKKSLNLDPLKLQEIFISHGPFLQDILGINQLILSSLNVSDNSSIGVFKNKDKIIISHTNRGPKLIRVKSLIIFKDTNARTYLFSTTKKAFRYSSKIAEHFLQNAFQYEPFENESPLSWDRTIESLSAISKSKKDLSEEELAKNYEFYFEFTRNFLSSLAENEKIDRKEAIADFSKEIQGTIDYIDGILEFSELNKLSELGQSLKRLQENLESDNLGFFSLNQ